MNWYTGTIPEAVKEAKRNNKILLVYIEGLDDLSLQMNGTYNDPDVAEKLSSEQIIPLKLIADSIPFKQFCAIYPVLVIPASFFIASNGDLIEIIMGSVSSSEFCSKVEKVLETYGNASAVRQETNSSPVASTSNAVLPAPSTSQTADSIVPEASTSQDSEDAELARSIELKLQRARAIIQAQRQNKALEEKEKEKAQEIERRNVGKAMQQAQQTKHDNELKEWAKNRAKEKEEERLAVEKVKAMIAQDRAERAAKYQAEQERKRQVAYDQEMQQRAEINNYEYSTVARIQFRLPDGSHTTHSFPADATLEVARRYVIEHIRPPFSNFSLCMTYPRRNFMESNYSESFQDLQLAPSAVLLILPAQALLEPTFSMEEGGGFLSNLIWFFFLPFRSVWNLLWSFLPGQSRRSNPPPSTARPNPQDSTGTRNVSDNRLANESRRESPFAKREGNIFRINNQSDDEENNTYNGNSTQQM